MLDPSGTEQQVPILGADKDKKTGNVRPLAGTMEDPEGAGENQYQRNDKICSVYNSVFVNTLQLTITWN